MGKPCVAGAEGIKVDVKLRQAVIGEKVLHEGDYITIDGGTGYVYKGEIPTVEPTFSDELKTLLGWADDAANSTDHTVGCTLLRTHHAGEEQGGG